MKDTENRPLLLTRIRELYEKMEHDTDMERAFLEDRDAFLIGHGFEPKEVEQALETLREGRIELFRDVLEDQERKLLK